MSKEKKATPAAVEPVKETKPAEPVVEYVTSTTLAEKLGTKGTIVRRWLRTLPQFQDSGYTRYKWHPVEDAQFLADAEASFKKYQKSDEDKKASRLEEARKKAEEKKAKAESGETEPAKPKKEKKSKPAPEPEPEEEEEDDEFEDDDEGEELE